jgi:hypothetical protein
MTQAVKEPLHYRLNNKEWIEVTSVLKYAEARVLYYLRTLDPFGDRDLRIKVTDIGQVLNLSKGTVSKALKRLDVENYIDLEITEAIIKLKTKVLNHDDKASPEISEGFPVGNQVSYRKPLSPVGNLEVLQETLKSCRKPLSPVGNLQGLDALQDKAPETSHTIQTLKTSHTSLNSTDAEKNLDLEIQEDEKEGSFSSVGQIFESIVQQLKQPTDSVQDQSSALPPKPVENSNPILKTEGRFKQGGKLPPWRTGTGPNDLNPEFVEWIRKWMCGIPPQRDRSKGDALSYIRKQENTGATPVLEARAEEWLLAAHKTREAQQQYEAIIVAAVAPSTEAPKGNPEASANFRKMREMLRPKKEPEIIDTSEVQARLSTFRKLLGWDVERSKQWFMETFGKPCDRLNDAELLDAVDQLEELHYEQTGDVTYANGG